METNGLPFPSHDSLFNAVSKHYLTSPPYSYPAYSNTGTGILGLALVAANRAAYGTGEPDTYAKLLKRDIFDPLALNGSHFLTTDENKHLVVVPSKAPEVAVRAPTFSYDHQFNCYTSGPRLPGCYEPRRRSIFVSLRLHFHHKNVAQPRQSRESAPQVFNG